MKDLSLKCFGKSEVVSFHEKPEIKWEEACATTPSLSRSWFELSKLQFDVRLGFIRDYWINALPYSSQLYACLDRFFSQVEEVGVVGVDGSAYLTYVLKKVIFFGETPLKDEQIDRFSERLDFPVPMDYLQFFRVHNGFKKEEDVGVFSSYVLLDEVKKVQSRESPFMYSSEIVDPHALFPFYSSFDLDSYQCFNRDWVVDGEVGNVSCTLRTGSVSNFQSQNDGKQPQIFATFLDWLIFYLENVS